MTPLPVDSVWFKRVTNADFFNIEKTPGTTQGGGGMTYFDIPKTARDALFRFLGRDLPPPEGPFPPILLPDVRAIGAPDQAAPLSMSKNRDNDPRYRIENQNRHMPGSQRHPAWAPELGFPQATSPVTDAASAEPFLTGGLRILLVRTADGALHAGFVEGVDPPPDWPPGLAAVFTSSDPGGHIAVGTPTGFDIDDIVRRVLDAWGRGRFNVLLYGPPGTGKTHAMNSLWRLLDSGIGPSSIFLDPQDRTRPFKTASDVLPIELPVAQDWVTFHQSYSYEDFIVGLRPNPTPQGVSLVPRVGRMLDLALEVAIGAAGSAVLMVDEVNRGNVARIFGEFITFMDPDYRAAATGSPPNPMQLPVPLPSVGVSGSHTQPLERPSGGVPRLPVPWYFPRSFYMVASMNSVDRAVAPLDSALGRRFERIEVGPDLGLLADWLGVAPSDVETALAAGGPPGSGLTAGQAGWLLLSRLNHSIATSLGPEFELGHTYLREVASAAGEDERFLLLATAWERALFPQLVDRFVGRPTELLRLLKVDAEDRPPNYLFGPRTFPFGTTEDEGVALKPVSLVDEWATAADAVRATLRFLAVP